MRNVFVLLLLAISAFAEEKTPTAEERAVAMKLHRDALATEISTLRLNQQLATIVAELERKYKCQLDAEFKCKENKEKKND